MLLEVVDAADGHAAEHRATVQAVLDELGAGDKPRLVALNKVDLIDAGALDPGLPSPIVGGTVPVSAATGFGLDALRTELAAVLASLWVDIDLDLPYAAGELLARVRERGSVDIEYRGTGSASGRVAPALAGELESVPAAAGLLEEAAHA